MKFDLEKSGLNVNLKRLSFLLAIAGIFTLVYDLGFNQSHFAEHLIHGIYILALSGGIVFLLLANLAGKKRPGKKIWFIDTFFLVLYLYVLLQILQWYRAGIPPGGAALNLALISVFIRELASFHVEIRRQHLNPAQLFIISFASIICAGALLLMLPNFTTEGIGFIDALFTSTSAVCVTGLSTVDVGKVFTPLGQSMLIILMEAGGIGIMTFTSYFGYFFKGGASYQNRLMIQDMTKTERISDVFNTLRKIIVITFLIEIAGAALIYASIDPAVIPGIGQRVFFSVFHAVSAFCNAGFSTLSGNLYEPAFRFNYPMHLTIAGLIIIGGIGFPIIFNALSYLKYFLLNRVFKLNAMQSPWVLGINARIVLLTSAILLIAGTVLIYFLEYNNSLADHKGAGKLISAFFSATTPRTAGFNSIDMSALHISSILVISILMWIGASPGSTGGGIKTSTFAISFLNFLSLARGKDRIEVFKREISPFSTRRAFAAISLSLIIIGVSIFFMAIFDHDKDLMKIAFESISAFGTVGLSLGITSSLSVGGKIVIILTMFIGRVSMLTILVAFMRRIINLKYKYPAEDILIN